MRQVSGAGISHVNGPRDNAWARADCAQSGASAAAKLAHDVFIMSRRRRERIGRVTMYALAALAIAHGALGLRYADATYENYWDGRVFAPFTLIVGLLMLGVTLRRRNWNFPRMRFPHDDVPLRKNRHGEPLPRSMFRFESWFMLWPVWMIVLGVLALLVLG